MIWLLSIASPTRMMAGLGYITAALAAVFVWISAPLAVLYLGISTLAFYLAYRRVTSKMRRWSKARARGERVGPQLLVSVTLTVHAPAEQLEGPMGLALRVGGREIDDLEDEVRTACLGAAELHITERWPGLGLVVKM